ncbi:MAG TPA: hypothetical protein VGA56_25910 [Opitutaceae bacterium]
MTKWLGIFANGKVVGGGAGSGLLVAFCRDRSAGCRLAVVCVLAVWACGAGMRLRTGGKFSLEMWACGGALGEFADEVDDQEAIDTYDEAGRESASARLGAVRWPDVALDGENLRRLVEGVLDEHLDIASIALGEGADVRLLADRIEEAWRLDEMRVRYAPEGVFVDAAFALRVTLLSADEQEETPEAEVLLNIESELCLSFTERNQTRPFVDFMGGCVRVLDDDPDLPGQAGATVVREKRIDPFALMVSPALAVKWGLNSRAPA